jgi:hypothetical protein
MTRAQDARIYKYLKDITGIGTEGDPVDVLIASHGALAARCAQVEADIQEIAKVCNAVQSVTHGPVSDAAGIIFAIRDLQECYGDAARARNGCYTKMQARAEGAESEVTKLKEQNRWIPCSERLPAPDEMVLITDKNEPGKWFVNWGSLVDDEPAWFSYAEEEVLDIGPDTHWRPLPEPPREHQGKESKNESSR